MARSLKRIAVAVLLALPGIGLAMAAKPFILGSSFLCFGLLLALLLPIIWLFHSTGQARGVISDLQINRIESDAAEEMQARESVSGQSANCHTE